MVNSGKPSYDEIRAMYRKEPFAPFRIEVSDGRAYDILEMSAMIVTIATLHVGIPSKRKRGYEGVEYVPVATVVKLTPLPALKANKG